MRQCIAQCTLHYAVCKCKLLAVAALQLLLASLSAAWATTISEAAGRINDKAIEAVAIEICAVYINRQVGQALPRLPWIHGGKLLRVWAEPAYSSDGFDNSDMT
jgi:hypothetical protein